MIWYILVSTVPDYVNVMRGYIIQEGMHKFVKWLGQSFFLKVPCGKYSTHLSGESRKWNLFGKVTVISSLHMLPSDGNTVGYINH